MSKKKILYIITQTHYGGAQKYVHDLALNIDKNLFDVTVAVGEGKEEAWMTDLLSNGIKVIRLKHVKRNLSPWHDLMSGFELYRLYKKLKPQVIHLNSSKVGATGAVVGALYKLFSKIKSIKIVYTVHGLVLKEPLSIWRKAYYWLAEKIGAYFKDLLICVSEDDKNQVLNWLITKPNKIKIVHVGIDLMKLNFLSRAEARDRLSTKTETNLENTIIIGTIGGYYKNKGFNYLVKAANQVIKELPAQFDKPKIKFIIIGSGPEETHLKQLVAKYKLQANIIMTSISENAAKYLKAFDVFVLPSVKEGLSYTLIEARAASLPIITTKVGGNPEIITQNKTGILVDPANSEALAKEVLNLIKHENIRQKLSQDTNQDIENFSLENMVKNTIKIY